MKHAYLVRATANILFLGGVVTGERLPPHSLLSGNEADQPDSPRG